MLVDQCVSRRMVGPALLPLADVAYVSDVAHSAPDVDVLELARSENRILITEDYDFGELVFGQGRSPPPGIVHLSLGRMNKTERDEKFAKEIAHLLDIAPGRFVVFSDRAPRSRPFP